MNKISQGRKSVRGLAAIYSPLSGENNKHKCKKREYSFIKDFNPLCNAQMRIHLHFAASRGDRSRQPREVKHTYLPSGLECFYWTKVCI